MTDAALEALLGAAADGVALDGLEVAEGDGTYSFDVPGTTRQDLDADELQTVATQHPAYVEEWYFWERVAPQAPARWQFLRWVEAASDHPVPDRPAILADGHSRQWGQLQLTVRSDGPGHRRYAVRHRADAGVSGEELESHDDPGAAHDIRRYTDDGTYRPLSTAPTLARGWVFPDLEAADVVATVERFYPATIANWHRERAGELDVTHWRETAERQTGMYDLVDELTGEQVAWLAEACCVDSQCLKRRTWDETADEPLDVPRGDGVFPCREPCSLVVAAAREIALAERQPAESVQLELSAAERAQLDRLLDAVADGKTGGIRDGDLGDGANRLRARYLRAKRAGDGTLFGDGTE